MCFFSFRGFQCLRLTASIKTPLETERFNVYFQGAFSNFFYIRIFQYVLFPCVFQPFSHIMQFIQTESYHIIFFMNILYVFIQVFDESECDFKLFTKNQDFHVLLCVSSDFLGLQTYNHIPHILSKNVFLHHIIFLLMYIIYVFIECSNESKFVFTFLTLKSRFSFSFNNSSS